MRGFTLLEVMVSLAIMASVILTVLGAVNYHLGIVAHERDSTALTLLARNYMLDEEGFPKSHSELICATEVLPTDYPFLQKKVYKVKRTGGGREVALVRYHQK